MKKKIGILVILSLLVFASQAFAGTLSKVGKKVSGESSVYVNGNQINSAIIVDNSAYAPLRAVAEALGVDLEYEKTSEGNVIKLNNTISDQEYIELMQKKTEVQTKINAANRTIERANKEKEAYTKKLESGDIVEQDIILYFEKLISESQQEIIQAQQDIITYTNELLELESAK